MSDTAQPCVDCVRLNIPYRGATRYCPADGAYRCRAHRTQHLAKQGVGKPVAHPPASVERQGSFL